MLSRYQTSITLTEEEKDLVEALKLRDIGTIDIFRAGLRLLCPGKEKQIKQSKKI